MDPFVERVGETLRRHAMVPERARVLVAVSGGADSVALLSALGALGVPTVAAHVNHRLRGAEADADERFVRRLAGRLGVGVVVLDGSVAAGPNLEERARERRYACLAEAAAESRCRRIAVAHTRDDQAETVLLRLFRGAGTKGLGGMAPVRPDGVVRPLLELGRDDARAYLDRVGLRFRRDRTNREMRFDRNRVRRLLMPLLEREFNPAMVTALVRTAELLREDERHLEAETARAERAIRRGDGLDAGSLGRSSPAIGRRVVRRWLAGHRGSLRGLGVAHVDAVLEVARGRAAAVTLPGGTVRRTRGELRWRTASGSAIQPFRIALEPGRAVDVGAWRLLVRRQRGRGGRPSRWRAVFDAAALGKALLTAVSAVPGTRIRPLGLGGSKKLQDVFVDGKVPREDRAAWPVVTAGSTILWVPGLVRSDRAPVSAATRSVVVLEARRTPEIRDVAAKNPMCYGRTRQRVDRLTESPGRRRTSRKEPI